MNTQELGQQVSNEPLYLNHTNLKKRPGWSEKVIDQFLPTPCTTRRNPHYRSAAPTKLYKMSRIKEVEAMPDWQQQSLLTNKRKVAAGLATETKRENLLQYVESLTITVPEMDSEELIELACAHYNAHQAWKQQEFGHDWEEASPDSDESFLKRITTNYLRHMLTRYEKELKRIAGKVGVEDAYERLKERVNEAIYHQYPHLEP